MQNEHGVRRMALIECSLHKPFAAKTIEINSVQFNFASVHFQGHVPLIAHPCERLIPPVPGTGPGTRGRHDTSMLLPQSNKVWLIPREFDRAFNLRPKETKRERTNRSSL